MNLNSNGNEYVLIDGEHEGGGEDDDDDKNDDDVAECHHCGYHYSPVDSDSYGDWYKNSDVDKYDSDAENGDDNTPGDEDSGDSFHGDDWDGDDDCFGYGDDDDDGSGDDNGDDDEYLDDCNDADVAGEDSDKLPAHYSGDDDDHDDGYSDDNDGSANDGSHEEEDDTDEDDDGGTILAEEISRHEFTAGLELTNSNLAVGCLSVIELAVGQDLEFSNIMAKLPPYD
ncbi:unnamed protein product [Calicophoron daubneyi]|uniref:Uncharacterized protein n=1 Tax=Calicophoron daubneyi TaxID=300641 RepID=A0AAV2SZ81_CALDB